VVRSTEKLGADLAQEKPLNLVATVAEQRFQWLLKQRHLRYWREDQLQDVIEVRGTRPDFYVCTRSHDCFLAEVESFIQPGPLRSQLPQATTMNVMPILQRIRTAVGHAARQLRQYERLNIPMLAVLDNWCRAGIPTNIGDLWDALFRPLRTGQPLLSARSKQYLSAVAWNIPAAPAAATATSPRQMCIRLIHNPFALVRFPDGIFHGPQDEHYQVKSNGRLMQI
jgi:hypothetical protein